MANATLNDVEQYKVVTLTPQQIPDLGTYPMARYSLFSIRNDSFEPIPYQFDEMTEDGFVYVEGADSLALTIEGVKSHLKGTLGFFDKDDQLLFMLRDAGPRQKKGMVSPGVIEAEISVKAADGKTRYVYLVRDPILHSDDQYVRYSSELGRAETDYYSLKVDQENALVWDEFYFDSFSGANPKQPFDTMKLGMNGHVLPAAAIPVYLTNASIRAKALAEKSGPIRATTVFRMTLKFLGIPWFVGKLQIRHTESSIAYDFILRMPELRRQAMGNLRAKMTMDGRDLQGSKVVFSVTPEKTAMVDGKLDELESEMDGYELDIVGNNWIWLDTGKKFATMMTFELSHSKKLSLKGNSPRVRFQYKDDEEKKQHHEFYKGQLPDAGFEVKLPQTGRVKMSFMYDMFASNIKMSAADVAEALYKMPEVNVTRLDK